MTVLTDTRITGTLVIHNETLFNPGDTLQGRLYGDTSDHGNHPFADGTQVNTSTIESVITRDGGVFVKTRNSIYRIKTVSDITK